MADTDVKPYRVVAENHVVKWDNQLQQSVEGWDVKALWLATQTIIPVFIPDGRDLNAGVDLLVRAQGTELDRLHSTTG
jgi:hypothetical protein